MSGAPAKPPIEDVATFLAATAAALHETLARYERTTARVTEYITTRPALADRDLVVTLQDFDRLQQELATLVEVLARAAGKSGESWLRAEGGGHPAEDTIATITIADLKDRLMYSLSASPLDFAAGTDEMVF